MALSLWFRGSSSVHTLWTPVVRVYDGGNSLACLSGVLQTVLSRMGACIRARVRSILETRRVANHWGRIWRKRGAAGA
jgi:hypothetical protein